MQVPTYGGQQVPFSPLPGVRQEGRQSASTPESLGAGVGGAISESAKVLYAHQEAEALRQDQARVVDAENGVSQWELKNIYDPKDGALAQTGVNSFGLPEKLQKSWEDNVGPIRESLSNDRQKEAFDRAVAGRKDGIFRQINAHVMGQMRAVEKDGNDSYISNSYQLAVANAGNPDRIAAEIDNSRVHAGMYAQLTGMDPESTKKYVESVTSNIHVGVIDRLLATQQPQKAQDYFDAAKDEIDRNDISKVERALSLGMLDGQAQAKARGILGTGWVTAPDASTMEGGTVTIDGGREKTLQEAIDEANKIDENDPSKTPLADQVRQRIRQSYQDFKTTQNEAQQRAAQLTKSLLDDAVTAEKARKADQASMIANGIIANHVAEVSVFDFIDKIAPGQRALMSPQDLSMWRSYAKQMSEKGTVDTDTETYYKLLQMQSSDPEAFKGENLNRYHAVIGDSDLKGFMKDQQAMIQNESKPSPRMARFRTNEQIIDAAMSARGMATSVKPDTPEWKEKMRAMAILDQQVADFETSTGKEATDPDIQRMMDNLIITKSIPTWFGFSSREETSFKPNPPSTNLRPMSINDVPVSEAKKIRAELRSQGITSTDDLVIYVYTQAHAGGKR